MADMQAVKDFISEEAKEKEHKDKKEKDEKEETEKALTVTFEDLQKGIAMLEDLSKSQTPTARRDALFAKAQAGTITNEERAELVKHLDGSASNTDNLARSVSATMNADEDNLSKAFDVSDFLKSFHGGLTKSLSDLATEIEKSDRRRAEVGLVQARAVIDTAKVAIKSAQMVKSLSAELAETRALLNKVLAQPASTPRAMGVPGAVPMAKSLDGNGSTGPFDGLTKSQTLDALEKFMEKGLQQVAGEDVLVAISELESRNRITPGLLAEVKKSLKS